MPPKGYSMHVGVNQDALNDPEDHFANDACAMAACAKDLRYEVRGTFLGSDAKLARITTRMQELVSEVRDRNVNGDVLLFTFSCHGWSNGDAQEHLLLAEKNKSLTDVAIRDILADVPAGCRVIFIADACKSRGITDPNSVDTFSFGGIGATLWNLWKRFAGERWSSTFGGGLYANADPVDQPRFCLHELVAAKKKDLTAGSGTWREWSLGFFTASLLRCLDNADGAGRPADFPSLAARLQLLPRPKDCLMSPCYKHAGRDLLPGEPSLLDISPPPGE